MGYDGIFAGAVARQLAQTLAGSRIEKVTQPEPDQIILQVNTTEGRKKLLLSASPRSAGVWFTELNYENPQAAPNFCMLLRKHIQGGRISAVTQIETERIIYFDIDAIGEMGYTVSRRLIAESMGKHSNLILIDRESGKILDSIKRISIDVNRFRQILPGLPYVLPPSQGKLNFWEAGEEEIAERFNTVLAEKGGNTEGAPIDKAIMASVQGLGPAAAAELAELGRPEDLPGIVVKLREFILAGDLTPAVYCSEDGTPKEVHIFPMKSIEGSCVVERFNTPGQALDFFYSHRRESNRVVQRGETLTHSVNALLDKQLLKKQRLLEDIEKADNAEILRLKGELLTANIHLVKPGDKSVKVISYYDGSEMVIELDERFSAAKNAQNYYKKYGKAKTAKKEKQAQLETCGAEIDYLESVLSMIPLTESYEELELIRTELIQQGYLRGRKAADRKKNVKPKPRRFNVCGYELLVGRNNTENDFITFKQGGKQDLWFHTKDIHGSHCVLLTGGAEVGEEEIFGAAAIAAWFSKGQTSENVPVDYVPLRYVHKPNGAKPGMVIFTNNRTVWVNPKNPEENGDK